MDQIVPNTKEIRVDKIAAEAPSPQRTFELHYKFGSHRPMYKVFHFRGNRTQAAVRGRAHCIKMNYTFISVRPFIVDLDVQESAKEGSLGSASIEEAGLEDHEIQWSQK